MTTSNYLSSHYGYSLAPGLLQAAAEARAANIVSYVTQPNPVLIFTGFSGIALATAISIELHKRDFKFEMLMVRKPGEAEQCHGRSIQSSISRVHKDCYFIFVDDFIDSGKTLARLDKVVEKFGGIKAVCTNENLKHISHYNSYYLSTEEDEYYNSLLEVVSV
jgi:adenine/guanine phosphoribosyltransferase-like PRPP-binding protein